MDMDKSYFQWNTKTLTTLIISYVSIQKQKE